jgi:CBS domain-containing protein
MSATVKDVMTTRVVAVRKNAPFKDIAALLTRYRVSAFPVLDDDGTVIGVVSEADLLCKEALTAAMGRAGRTARAYHDDFARAAAVTAGPGMRDWLGNLGHWNGLAAAFDTRINGVPAFTGRASRRIARLLRRLDHRLVAAPESFLIGSQNTLLDGEAARARRWGMTLGAVSKTYLSAPA